MKNIPISKKELKKLEWFRYMSYILIFGTGENPK